MSLIKISSHQFITSNPKLYTTQKYTHRKHVKCKANFTKACVQTIPRRLANYNPTIWEDEYVQSLPNNNMGEIYMNKYSHLKKDVKRILGNVEDELMKFELIDIMQRLGISYQFQYEIRSALENVYNKYFRDERLKNNGDYNLFLVALEFRIMRQNGFNVSQEIFNKFKDNDGNFKSNICEDIKGMLYLYEASFLSIKGETILDEARDFTAKFLQEHLKKKGTINNVDPILDLLVQHALELPLHWRMLRLEARWFIDVYAKQQNVNTTLLEFAKMDFNMVQASHKEELKQMSRWWKSTYLGEKLSFARDRLMQQYFWTTGVLFEPEYGYARKMSTKINSLVTIIDDIYDVYGSLEELQLFTNAVQRVVVDLHQRAHIMKLGTTPDWNKGWTIILDAGRINSGDDEIYCPTSYSNLTYMDIDITSWNTSTVDKLPDYMKICFLSLFNSTNEMAYNTLVDKGVYVIPYFAKAWTDLCESFMLEARWYYSGYTPTLEEYIQNAWISISSPLVLRVAYLFVANNITANSLECLKEYPNIIRMSSTILRLSNDLGTSTQELERGDNPKSIQCYMHETGASESEAREYIKNLISELWKKINQEMYDYHHSRRQHLDSPFEEILIGIAMNAARMAQCVYQHGDGHGIEDKETKGRVLALLINPIS